MKRNNQIMDTYGHTTHKSKCCPKEWEDIPVITGEHELDAVITYNDNQDMVHRLALYCGAEDTAYGQVTGYSGYQHYHGDD